MPEAGGGALDEGADEGREGAGDLEAGSGGGGEGGFDDGGAGGGDGCGVGFDGGALAFAVGDGHDDGAGVWTRKGGFDFDADGASDTFCDA